MANELALSCSINFNKNNVSISEAVNSLLATVTGNGLNSIASYSLSTSATAIPLGSVSVAGGFLFVQNLDPTNYITVLTGTSGTAVARLLPGEFCLYRMDPNTTAPAFQAHTGSCLVKFCIFDL